MKYKLFLCDFDGTLVRDDGTVSQKNLDAIHAYRKMGGTFAIVTGRMPSSIRPRLLEMGLSDTLLAAYQGGIVARTDTGEYLRENVFLPQDCAEILSFLEQREALHLHVYDREILYSNRDDIFLQIYEKKCGVKGEIADCLLSEKVQREGLKVPKICVMGEPNRLFPLFDELARLFGKRFCVTGSSEYMVEILPLTSQKGFALEFLANYYHIPLEEVAAIGDERNDLSMISRAGGKFAVGNAVRELREAARLVRSCEEDGVSEALSIAMGEA